MGVISNKNTPANSRERLAWGFLLSSFAICVLLTVAIPISVGTFIQNATRLLPVSIQANQGAVRLSNDAGLRRVVLAGEVDSSLGPGTRIQTDAGSTANLFFTQPDSQELLARLQVYSNTILRLGQANTPRFAWSDASQEVVFELQNGRLRLILPANEQRPLTLSLHTPQSTLLIDQPGTYSLEVNRDETQVTVQNGRARVTAVGALLELLPGQRAEIKTDRPPRGPLDPQRNFVQNGDFSNSFDNWALFAWNVELPEQPAGDIDVIESAGESVLHMVRNGAGHADVQVRQSLNQDVADFESLRLLMTLSIVSHDLGVCGFKGSECPLFVRLNYVDEDGVSRTWQQGFYNSGLINDNTTPGACISCAVVQSSHVRTTPGQLYVFDVNMGAEIARQGFVPPRFIESLTLVASGHSFEVEVYEVALVAEE